MSSSTRTSDRALLLKVRSGDRDAYGSLWARHAETIRAAAGFFTSFDADDITAETFTRILRSIDRGYGPVDTFRTYALVTARNVATEWGRGAREIPLDAVAEVEDPTLAEFAAAVADDRSLAMRAFHSLPDRWQEVLWYSEVEQMKPAEMAPILGMSANSVAALAVRAREGLKQGWISAHVRSDSVPDEHKWVIERAAKYARNKLPVPARRTVDEHLEDCPNCRLAYAEIDQASSRIALVLLPVVLGAAAPGYAAWVSARAPHPGPTSRGRTVRASAIGGAAVVALAIVGLGIALEGDRPAGSDVASSHSPGTHLSMPEPQRPERSTRAPAATATSEPAPPTPPLTALTPPSSAGRGVASSASSTQPRPVQPAPQPVAAATDPSGTSVGPVTEPTPAATPPVAPPPTRLVPAPPRFAATSVPAYLVPALIGTAEPGATVATAWTDDNTVIRFTTTASDDGSWTQPAPNVSAAGTFTVTATQTVTAQGRALTSTASQRTIAITDELTVFYRLVDNQYVFDLVGLPGLTVEVADSANGLSTLILDDAGRATVVSPAHPDDAHPALVMLRYSESGTHGVSQDLSFLLHTPSAERPAASLRTP